MAISRRIMTNVSYVEKNACVADVGCDHAYALEYLLSNNIASYGYALDIGEGPLLRARKTLMASNLLDRCEIRRSDGLEALYFKDNGELEADTLILAGLGGRLALRILEAYPDKTRALKRIILQAQSDLYYVRESLKELGLCILDETFLYEEGKHYTSILLARGHQKQMKEQELLFGPFVISKKNEDFRKYLAFLELKFQEICANTRDERAAEKLKLINETKKIIGEDE